MIHKNHLLKKNSNITGEMPPAHTLRMEPNECDHFRVYSAATQFDMSGF